MLVGAAAADEVALETQSVGGTLTQRLRKEMELQPTVSFDALLAHVASGTLQTRADTGSVLGRQHPDMAVREGAGEQPGGQRFGLFVANEQYKHQSPLNTKKDAEGLASSLGSRGYRPLGKIRYDKTAPEMKEIFEEPAKRSELHPGDSLVLHFAGHGVPEGLVGIDHSSTKPDVLKNAEVLGVLDEVANRGVSVSFLSDACHSGAAADQMRTAEVQRATSATKGTHLETLGSLAREVYDTIDWLRTVEARQTESQAASPSRVLSRAATSRGFEIARDYVSPEDEAVIDALDARLTALANRFAQLVPNKRTIFSGRSTLLVQAHRNQVIYTMTTEVLAALEACRVADADAIKNSHNARTD